MLICSNELLKHHEWAHSKYEEIANLRMEDLHFITTLYEHILRVRQRGYCRKVKRKKIIWEQEIK